MARQKWHPKPIRSVRDFPHALLALLSSLKLAVVVIVGLALALTAATLLESYYDTATAQYYVYRSIWFYGIMGLLGLNILTVALSRYPWEPRQLPFLIAHLGILILLFGSVLTYLYGVDAMLRVGEGESASVAQLDTASVVVGDRDGYKYYAVPWRPPGVGFKPVDLRALGSRYPIAIEAYLTHADSQVVFKPTRGEQDSRPGAPALQVEIKGGPMRIRQAFWLWAGEPGWARVQAGPALLVWGELKKNPQEGRPSVAFWEAEGKLRYRAFSSSGTKKEGLAVESEWDPGWKGVSLRVLSYVAKAVPETQYEEAQIQYGRQAPSSAVKLKMGSDPSGIWMGLGDRALYKIDGKDVEVGYLPDRVLLPISIRLDRFEIQTYPGTMDPASYSSRVSVLAPRGSSGQNRSVTISMNEPLSENGYTLYQASYEEGLPRPTVSIFSINRDPGRFAKYFGSILLVFGAISLFVLRTWVSGKKA